MAELKTKVNDGDVSAYLKSIEDEQQKADCEYLMEMMSKVTRSKAEMWGKSLVGFGRYQYQYANGKPGEWFLTGFSPRKNNLSIYIMPGFSDYPELMEQLGKHKTGKSCLYIKKLTDVDPKVLKKLVQQSVKDLKKKHA